jgi:hypothetical protein
MKLLGRILLCAGIAAFILSINQLRADPVTQVRIFASKELAGPLEAIAKGDKAENLILRPETELTKWVETTDLGWAIVISADPKAPFCMNSPLKRSALLRKGRETYYIYLTMSAVSIPADNRPQISARAYLLSAKSLEIFHSYGFQSVEH